MKTLFSEDITVMINGKILIDESRITINTETKYSVLGVNGIGKTTLINEIVKKLDGVDYLYLEQDVSIEDSQKCFDFLLKADDEGYNAFLRVEELCLLHEMSDEEIEEYNILTELLNAKKWNQFESEAKKILKGLGFLDINRSTSELSGGWRMKLALGKALLRKPELLILDEPTNHLDLIACIWLSDYLSRYNKSIIMITHDIDITYSISDVIWYIGNLDLMSVKVYTIRGNFTNLAKFISDSNKKNEDSYNKYQKALAAFKKKGRTRTELEDFENRYFVPRPPKDYIVSIEWPTVECRFKDAFSLRNVSFSYPSKKILDCIDFNIFTDSRYVLVGNNGAGKTTLFKLCLGNILPDQGGDCIIKDPRLRIGYYNQQIIDSLPLDMTAVEYLKSISSSLSVGDCKGILGKMSLRKTIIGDPTNIKISDLSGGQKARVAFAKISVEKPHIILFDEPTNHLDYESMNGLIDGINNFNGGVVIITHSMHLIRNLNRVQLFSIENQKVLEYKDGFESYYRHIIDEIEN
uniref:ABC transporter domain-containing protein n=1 Tax=viral metagenome TaxID=1070528 RepID=A0A6C0BDY8_9ZZZZ